MVRVERREHMLRESFALRYSVCFTRSLFLQSVICMAYASHGFRFWLFPLTATSAIGRTQYSTLSNLYITYFFSSTFGSLLPYLFRIPKKSYYHFAISFSFFLFLLSILHSTDSIGIIFTRIIVAIDGIINNS